MSQYYQNQQRPFPSQQNRNGGSVKVARERAEALTPGQMTERAQPIDPRWAHAAIDNGRNYATGRPRYDDGPPSPYSESMRPPPSVWRTAPYSSAQASSTSSVEDLTATPQQQRSRGELAQNFRFPPHASANRASPQRLRRNQGPQTLQLSPATESPNSPAWPLPRPDRAQPTQPMAQRRPGAVATQLNPYDTDSIYSRPSEPATPPAQYEMRQHSVVRNASKGTRAKPVLTTIRSPEPREDNPSLRTPKDKSVDAVSAAIAAGMARNSVPPSPQSTTKTTRRMPFTDESPPISPNEDVVTPLEPPKVFSRSSVATPDSGTSSTRSHNPLLGSEPRPAMSDRIPSSKRPPRLNMQAVHDLEARGSTTSLSELIRRATKLASNLERGKTASRLGMLDMFNATDKERHASGSISDMLSAFPEPGMTPNSATGHGHDALGNSNLRHSEFPSRDSRAYQPSKSGRRLCGLSVPVFLVVLTVLVILIAAAVLVPLFLIVLPREAANSLTSCSSTHVCQNMGISVVSDNRCSCVCTNGYTGDHCQQPIDAECTTTTVNIGGRSSNSATAGSAIPDILSGASSAYSIPLNSTAIMALFAMNNLSCVTENSLVTFNLETVQQQQKRFVPVRLPFPAMPTEQPRVHNFVERGPETQSSTVASLNGIVYQAPTSTTDTLPSATGSTTSASPSPSSSTSANTPISQKTLTFAQVVVLYVLEQSSTLSAAVYAQQTMQSYLATAGGAANGTLSVGNRDLQLSADFATFQVRWANGTNVGRSAEERRMNVRRWVWDVMESS